MAINLVEEPSTTAPIDSDDWAAMYNNMMAGAVPLGSILTDWTSTSEAPSLGQGGFIRYEGNLYQVQDEDEAISGSVSSGLNYIVMTLSGTTLTAAWGTDKSDYSWDPAYGGMYNSDDVRDMLLPDMCYLSSSTYYRGYSVAAGNKAYVMGNGSIVTTNQLSSNSLYVSGDGTFGGDVDIDDDLDIGGDFTQESTGGGTMTIGPLLGNQASSEIQTRASTGDGTTANITEKSFRFKTTTTKEEAFDAVRGTISSGSEWGLLGSYEEDDVNYALWFIQRTAGGDIEFYDRTGTVVVTLTSSSDTLAGTLRFKIIL